VGPVLAFGWQFPFPHRSSRNGSSGEPVEGIRNLQNRSACAGIGQLSRHLPCLFGAIQPFQGFIRDRHHRVLPSLLESGRLAARPSLATDFLYRNHTAASDETACQIAAQSPSEKNKASSSPAPDVSFVTEVVGSDRDRPV
jgi:hypothetical protein